MPTKKFSPNIPLLTLVTMANIFFGVIWYQTSSALFDAAVYLNELALYTYEEDEEEKNVEADDEELLCRIERRLREIQRQQLKQVK